MPAPFAVCPAPFLLVLGRSISRAQIDSRRHFAIVMAIGERSSLQFVANMVHVVPDRNSSSDENLTWFAFLQRRRVFARRMMTGYRYDGRKARSVGARSVQAVIVAGLLGLAPLAASSAAAPDAGTKPATAAAIIELVPVPATTNVTAPIAQPRETVEADVPQERVLGRGSASYYAAKFDGRRTASGERFDNDAMTAAHRTLPFGTQVRVTNPANGRSVVVRINDRGPFTRGRLIDVSRAAADELGLVARGHATVELALIAD
jgi:rare lipoprotein A